ncbi:KAP family P-loop NTPase fold protein [Dysosmobacter sp.]|jgi:hypothetical protein|uniref:KAP family P-loop NTPase fold protein n=1 Tax=Dysosmobacter sp. TaxID=2591382 RepID=UPI003D91DC15
MCAAQSDSSNVTPVVSGKPIPIDLLNRQTIVDQMIHLLDILSDSRSSCTFALNGKWGSGKTFVLNMLERQLREYQDGEQYIVFHYNCWQYDYYEEPLVAIIAAMLDSLDEQTKLLSSDTRESLRRKMAAAKPILKTIAASFAKNKLGLDLAEVFTLTDETVNTVEQAKEKIEDEHAYDQYYAFKEMIQSAKAELEKLAATQMVVIVVDELDRCLPSYAIKVLERLHHLFYGLENVSVLLAVDKLQLDTTVKQIFGENTNVTTYLKKFINFELTLDVGVIEGSFTERYADYIALFDETLLETNFSIDKFFAALFSDIEIREQERLMDRIKTVHQMLFPQEKKDYSFMCFELLWLVFSELYSGRQNVPIYFDGRDFQVRGTAPHFTEYMQTEWNNVEMRRLRPLFNEEREVYSFPAPIDIPQLLLWYLWQMYPDSPECYQIPSDCPRLSEYQKHLEDFKKIDALLELIK